MFQNIFKILRHVFIRGWERLNVGRIKKSDLECDFWLVCHSKDSTTAMLTIESIRLFSLNPIRQIFIVGDERDRPEWISHEINYIFEGELLSTSVALEILQDIPYKGWILQQILKYSAVEYSERFVIIDCDTVLLKPHLFFTNLGTVLRLSYEHSPHYRKFEQSLNINGGKYFSFTCHMMPYKSDLLRELLDSIEEITGQNWVEYLCQYARKNGMVINEQDLYARYIIQSNEEVIFLPWLNKTVEISKIDSLNNLINMNMKRNSVSFHNNESRKLIIPSV